MYCHRGVYTYKEHNASKWLRPNLIPHYFADYDLSLRVKKKGYSLLISRKPLFIVMIILI